MHPLFRLVLAQKDLSRAGDLFSLTDTEIEDSLTDALEQLQAISSSPDYPANTKAQAVVEICVMRVTAAIRGTGSIERHARALVGLWASCLEQELHSARRDEDTPHTKIASDVLSCILQNYSRAPVMALAVPVAVKFLQWGRGTLGRTMSNYLSLAAVSQAELLAEHTEAIVTSILQGNTVLLRVLPAVYDMQPQPINNHLSELLALLAQLEQSEQYHLLRLLPQAAKKKQVEAVETCVPLLVGHLLDSPHPEVILNTLLEIAGHTPAALRSSLPALAQAAERCPSLLGQMARIYSAVGHLNEESARSCLPFLVAHLASTGHSCHHVLLLEIKHLTDAFAAILGPHGQNIFRLSNSFMVMAKLLAQQLNTNKVRGDKDKSSAKTDSPEKLAVTKLTLVEKEDAGKLQVKPQSFEDKVHATSNTPGSVRRYSLGQVSKEEKKDVTFNRCRSFAWHMSMEDVSADHGEIQEDRDLPDSVYFSEMYPLGPRKVNTDQPKLESTADTHQSVVQGDSENLPKEMNSPHSSEERNSETTVSPEEPQDKLYLHLKDNLSRVKAYTLEMAQKLPAPDQCTIEGSERGSVARLLFTCSLKGLYCLYSKSSFVLVSPDPQLWIRLMFLFHQDLDQLQLRLEEVRFFDVFGLSEASAGSWQCFMCNNPERAAVVNQEGQPLMEGKLKEKQVRWKFIKRWKTRYFTLAGNQLLFQKGKCKDDPEDTLIELSKIQSVKVVAKKRRDRALPRAFEIFTDCKSYILKAKDEKAAEQWLQCLHVALAQAREQESKEVSTYL
ncbi:ventricular zone-expressed PH domain-containing protein homolog 1 isoform X2 [Suncus etruscus]|uniref:ventricular zone-expressed PH domain-containing protein homolog 1 isoform X2 n=1 Tax=Suncus etruscus TaxID=109475 RepID=UPI00210F4C72|nr:ventricular zone-expressed PH domain-containing protein homolog 1 isoform X2 [Suncus etruscus]